MDFFCIFVVNNVSPAAGDLIEVTDDSGNAAVYSYDANGHPFKIGTFQKMLFYVNVQTLDSPVSDVVYVTN